MDILFGFKTPVHIFLPWNQHSQEFFSIFDTVHCFIRYEEIIQQGIWLIFTQHRGFLTTQLHCEPTIWNYIGFDVSRVDLAWLTVYHICMCLLINKQHFVEIWKHMFLNSQIYLTVIFNDLNLMMRTVPSKMWSLLIIQIHICQEYDNCDFLLGINNK